MNLCILSSKYVQRIFLEHFNVIIVTFHKIYVHRLNFRVQMKF